MIISSIDLFSLKRKVLNRYLYLFFFLFTIPSFLNAQDLSLEWIKTLNGGSSQSILDENIQAILTDQEGNLIITGFFTDTMDLDPGVDTLSFISTNYSREQFIMKMDSAGSLIWVKTLIGNSAENIFEMDIDSAGNIYCTGLFWQTVDFDPGLGVENRTAMSGERDIFILKLDENGEFVWVKTIGGPEIDSGADLFIDDDENIYLLGYYSDSVDFDPGDNISMLYTPNGYSNYLLKLDAQGDFVWAKNVIDESAGIAYFSYITFDSEWNIYLGGISSGSVDFDPGIDEDILIANATDICIMKLDSSGNYLWAKVFGGSFADECNDIICDNNDDVIITGEYRGYSDFDPGPDTYNLPANGNSYEVFVAKLSSDGELIWASPIYGYLSEFCKSVALDQYNNIYITGSFHFTTDFDPSDEENEITSNSNSFDFFIVKLSELGQLIWVETYGDVDEELAYYIHVKNDDIYVTGLYSEPFTIGSDDSSLVETLGVYDIFIAKFQQCTELDVTPVPLVADLEELTFSCVIEELEVPQALNSCGDPIFATTDTQFPIEEVGDTTITWTYTNSFGSSVIQEQIIAILNDTIAPVPTIMILSEIVAECSLESISFPSATDNCSSVNVSHNGIFPIDSIGSTEIIWTYSDENGNESSQVQIVTIVDTEVPVADASSLVDLTAECSFNEELIVPTATDACSGVIVGVSDAVLPITEIGSTIITWTFEDANGNNSTQEQTIIVEDTEAPILDQETLADLSSECSIETPIIPTAYDICSDQSISATSDVSFPIVTAGITTIIWTFDDGFGNITTQNQIATITPIDNTIEWSQNLISAVAGGYSYQWIDCDNGNQEITDEINQDFLADVNGNYAVIISNDECSVTSECVQIVYNSISETVTSEIRIYPNPSSDFIFIENPLKETLELEIMDITGAVLKRITIHERTNKISLFGLSSGNYIIKIKQRDSVTNIKLIKR